NPKGSTMTRREDFRLITGQGRYTSDCNLPGQLHAVFLRADRAHAEILRIDTTQALKHPGVIAVYTHADIKEAGFKSLPNPVGFPGRGGMAMHKPYFNVLAMDRVNYVGEAVAMVIAETAAVAEDARELIEIEYRDLPSVSHLDDALKPGAPLVHDSVPGNLAFDFESGDEQAVAAAFASATFTSKVTVDSQRLCGNAMEPRSLLVAFDPANERYTMHTLLQGQGGMRGQLMHVSGLDKDKIELVVQDVGGSFGVRGPAYPENFAMMYAAKKLKRPVKWVATRSETFVSDFHGRALSLSGELALDADGKVLAIRFDDRADMGAYGAGFGPFIATRNITITAGGVYRFPAIYVRSRLVLTNTVPVSAYRGAGRPDIAYAVERLIDHAAHEHGFDPIALRRKNFIPPSAMPYKTANGTVYDSGDFEAIMNDGLKHSDYAGFERRRAAAKAAGKLRGMGIATYLEAGGGGNTPKDQVSVTFAPDGKLTLYAVTQASGQGHETVFPQIVADALGISAEHIHFHPMPPAAELVGNGTGGSRGALGTGSVFHVLGQKLIEVAKPHAAQKLGRPENELRYSEGRYHAGDRSMDFVELAAALGSTTPHPLNCVGEATYGATFPNGCHIAEVEIDPETGATTIEKYIAVDDLGNVINHTLVAGQVHGGVVQGAGQVFGEHAVYDPATGQLLSGSFMDYTMPRANLLRDIAVYDHPVTTTANALGAKGVGEAGCSGSLPALVNAVVDALRPLGIKHLDMPFTPHRVWQAIQNIKNNH
ncbi:MAG: xanthine dehydrogenase family protein molybdopterin-binding subunit, partial [Burkholderiales bacterium]